MKKIIVAIMFLATTVFAVNVNDPWAPGPNGLQLGSATSGNFVGTLAAGNGMSTTGAATGENIAHSISVNQDYNFNMTGNFTCTPAGTDDINLVTDSDSNLIITGMTDVSGDAVCISSGNVAGTCAAAVFTTSVSTPAYLSAATGGADDMTFSPGAVLGMTLAETTGNLTVVGDITASGGDVNSTNFNGSNLQSTATGGADDIDIKPATVSVFKATEAGEVQLTKPVTAHSACAAAEDVGRIDVFSVGDTKSFCGCWQSGAGTYAWVGLHAGAVCS